VELVQRFPFAIVSVDSALVYRELDIGTAKPDAATLRRAPHRLINLLDPSESYSSARFRADATREIRAIRAEGRIPLLVGGTMLYYRALQQGLTALPAADPTVRTRLEAALAESGLAALHDRLAAVDPAAAARIHPHDRQRIQRALEVYELTGRPITELYRGGRNELELVGVRKLILAPAERTVLHRRIEQRFHQMLEQGFVAEVERLRQRGDLSLDQPALRAVGYRQVWNYLAGVGDYPGMVQHGIAATRQFARRQLTWLRAESEAVWLDSLASNLLDQVCQWLRGSGVLTGTIQPDVLHSGY
jgi:tRNA dimethylallyltransferase